MRPVRPALWRELGTAYRAGSDDGATQRVLQALESLQQR